jgi:hypothetical protein
MNFATGDIGQFSIQMMKDVMNKFGFGNYTGLLDG